MDNQELEDKCTDILKKLQQANNQYDRDNSNDSADSGADAGDEVDEMNTGSTPIIQLNSLEDNEVSKNMSAFNDENV